MSLPDFRAHHGEALELDEVKHGLILNALAQAGGTKSVEGFCWTLGGPGECAIKMGHHSIVLGALDEDQCRRLADLTAASDYNRCDRTGPRNGSQIEHRNSACNSSNPNRSRYTRSASGLGIRDHLGTREKSRSRMRRCSPTGWQPSTVKPSRMIQFRPARNSNGLPAKIDFCSG